MAYPNKILNGQNVKIEDIDSDLSSYTEAAILKLPSKFSSL